jgi:hypothetical protein
MLPRTGLLARFAEFTLTRSASWWVVHPLALGYGKLTDGIIYSGQFASAVLIQMERPRDIMTRVDGFSTLADRREASVASETLHRYVGGYKFGERTIGVSLTGDRLWLRLPDFPDKPRFSASNSRFFCARH